MVRQLENEIQKQFDQDLKQFDQDLKELFELQQQGSKRMKIERIAIPIMRQPFVAAPAAAAAAAGAGAGADIQNAIRAADPLDRNGRSREIAEWMVHKKFGDDPNWIVKKSEKKNLWYAFNTKTGQSVYVQDL